MKIMLIKQLSCYTLVASCFNSSARPRYSSILLVTFGQTQPTCWALSSACAASWNAPQCNQGFK